jgi:hypothetical protein
METTILTLEQMKEAYPDEWLLIAFTAVDAYFNVVAGEVVAHSKERDEIYAALVRCKDKSFAIEHTLTLILPSYYDSIFSSNRSHPKTFSNSKSNFCCAW